jgi:hypothetical protein
MGFRASTDKDDMIRGFITRRAHHEGIIDIHHIAGHVGTLIWGFFCLTALYRCSRFVASVPLNAATRTANFGATLVIMNVLTYWFLYGNLSEMLPDFYSFLFCFVVGQVIMRNHPNDSPLSSSSRPIGATASASP